jgi:MoxR-like ATPase
MRKLKWCNAQSLPSLPRLEAVTTASELVAAQHFIRNLPVAENVVERAVELVRLTRDPKQQMHKYIRWGAGPRASQYLVAAARVKAALQGKLSPDVSDLDAVLLPVLQHRILTNFSAETDGVRVQDIITTIAGNK